MLGHGNTRALPRAVRTRNTSLKAASPMISSEGSSKSNFPTDVPFRTAQTFKLDGLLVDANIVPSSENAEQGDGGKSGPVRTVSLEVFK